MRHLRTGTALLIFAGVFMWLGSSVAAQILKLSDLLDFRFVEYGLANKILNLVLQLSLLIFFAWLIGYLMNKRWFRSFVLKLFSKIPVLSTVISFFFDHNYIEKLSSGKVKVVGIKFSEDVHMLGLQTNEFGENKEKSFVYGATSPMPATGFVFLVNKQAIVETKFTLSDFFRIAASYGLNYSEKKDPENPST